MDEPLAGQTHAWKLFCTLQQVVLNTSDGGRNVRRFILAQNLEINAIPQYDDILRQLAFQCLHKTELFINAENLLKNSAFNTLKWKNEV